MSTDSPEEQKGWNALKRIIAAEQYWDDFFNIILYLRTNKKRANFGRVFGMNILDYDEKIVEVASRLDVEQVDFIEAIFSFLELIYSEDVLIEEKESLLFKESIGEKLQSFFDAFVAHPLYLVLEFEKNRLLNKLIEIDVRELTKVEESLRSFQVNFVIGNQFENKVVNIEMNIYEMQELMRTLEQALGGDDQ